MLRKILKKKTILVLTIAFVVASLGLVYAAGSKGQTSSLSGQVVSVVSTGTKVTEGSVLVTVKTLAGSSPAVRSNCSGTVVSVSVSPGSNISAGQVVAQVQP
jgi:biotin carboxyl carrier protein